MKLLDRFKIQTYNIGVVYKPIGQVLNTGLESGDIIWLKHKYKDRFFADPFLIDSDEKYFYILVEEYCFWEEKGKISLLAIDKLSFELVDKKLVIEEETHLSFPFCEYRGNTIVPESIKSNQTIEYSFDLNKKVVIDKKKPLSEGLIDAAFYKEINGTRWIFASKFPNPKSDLYSYKYIGNCFIPCNSGKPVEENIENTRSAGRFFTLNGCLYRLVQNSKGRYGQSINILRINGFNNNCYSYDVIKNISSINNPPFNETFHTFNVYGNCIIVDGSKDYVRFPMKLLYKIRKKIKK